MIQLCYRTFHKTYGLQTPSAFPGSPPTLPCTCPLFQSHFECFCTYQNVPCPLVHQGLCTKAFFYLNHCVPMTSNGELRLLLRTSSVTPLISSANSPGKVTQLSPFHSALLILLSQHLPYYTSITGSQSCFL